MNLDIKTIFFLISISAFVMCFSMIITASSHPQIKGINKWAYGCGGLGVGWILFAFRGSVPDSFSIVIANTLLVTSCVLFYQSILNFKGRHSSNELFYAVIGLVFLVLLYLTYVQPSYYLRTILVSFFCAFFTFLCTYLLLIKKKHAPLVSEWIMGLGFFVIAFSAGIRVLHMVLFFDESENDLLIQKPFHSLEFSLIFVSILVLTFSFTLMINDKFLAEILRLATLDSLTEVYNRAAVEKLIKKEIERSRRYNLPMSLLLIDLDHFKKVNDTYGHQVGDIALKLLVGAILKELRDHDIFGRYGGEEFIILLPETSLADSQVVSDRIRQIVADTGVPAGDKSFNITISIGLATLRPKTDNFQQIFRRADMGLYKAKQSGRNQVVAIRDEDFPLPESEVEDDSIFKSSPNIQIPKIYDKNVPDEPV